MHSSIDALAMGLDNLHVCVLLGFVKRLYAGIDGFNVLLCWNLMKDYVLELIIACVYSAGI
jgi:hypothetical protein